MQLLASNNAKSTLAANVDISATTIEVAATTGALFPQPDEGNTFFMLTITDALTGDFREIVQVTAIDGDTFTVVRAQEGTTARAWATNDICANLFTAGTFDRLGQIDDAGVTQNIKAIEGLTTPLSADQGGTGNNTGNSPSADKLSTARTIRVNLASNTAPPFDGTGNITPGVTGALPIANGGHGQTTLPLAQNALGIYPIWNSTLYVSATGNDTNAGTSAGAALLTLQAAVNKAMSGMITGDVTINIGAGTFAGASVSGVMLNGAKLNIVGAGVGSTTINSTLTAVNGARVQITNASITTTAGVGLYAGIKGTMLFGSVSFGAVTGNAHAFAELGGYISAISAYAITAASGAFHIWTRGSGTLGNIQNVACTITNTPNFSFFVYIEENSSLYAVGWTKTGSTTGGRYVVTENSVIIAGTTTATGRDTFFPGDHNVSDTSTVDQPNVGGRFDSYPDYGFTTLQTINAAGLTTVEFPAVPDCFGQMFIWWSGVTLSATGATFNMQFKPAGQTVYNTSASFYQILDTVNTTLARPSAASALNIQASTGTANACYGSVCLNGYHGGTYPLISGNYTDCANNFHTVQGVFLDPNWIRNIRLVASGGTFTAGTFKLIAIF